MTKYIGFFASIEKGSKIDKDWKYIKKFYKNIDIISSGINILKTLKAADNHPEFKDIIKSRGIYYVFMTGLEILSKKSIKFERLSADKGEN